MSDSVTYLYNAHLITIEPVGLDDWQWVHGLFSDFGRGFSSTRDRAIQRAREDVHEYFEKRGFPYDEDDALIEIPEGKSVFEVLWERNQKRRG